MAEAPARSALTDRAATGGWVPLLCWLAVVLDGYDLVVLGALIPVLTDPAAPWMTPEQATAIATLSLVGMMVGALSIGAATDILGRRRVLIGAVAGFSLVTLACAFAQTPWQLGALRVIAGVGLGGALPTAIAMVTEFAPGRPGQAATRVMTGYHVGAVATAVLGLVLISSLGWRAMFVAGALPGLLLPLVMWRRLPESPAFLLAKGRRAEAEAVARANGLALPSQMTAPVQGAPVAVLLSRPYLRTNLAIWVTSFMGLLLVYGLNTWLPKLMVEANYGLKRGLWFLLLMNVGAILGLLVSGRVGDRIGLWRAARIWFLAGAVLLCALAWRMPPGLLYPTIFLTGSFVFSAQVLVYAVTAARHPAAVRATALGMAAGIGRTGAIAGPLIAGLLVSRGLGYPWGFFLFAAVGLAGAIALSLAGPDRRAAD